MAFDGFEITLVRGGTKRIRATVEINDVAQNITTWTEFWFSAKEGLADLDADAVIAKTLTGGGIDIVTAASGLIEIDIGNADTIDLSNYVHWLFTELKGRDGDGNLWPLKQGTLKISPSVVEAVA